MKTKTKVISGNDSVAPESVVLFCTAGGRDAEYHLALEQCETGWSVFAKWGRRGSALQSEYKIERAAYADAKKIYDTVFRQKLAKNYLPPTDDRKPVASVGLIASRPVSQMVVFAPELLSRISERELLAFVRSPRHWFQWKRDGERLTAGTEDGGETCYGYNKLGRVISLDTQLSKAIRELCKKFKIKTILFDGEWEGSGYWAWDVLQVNDMDMRRVEYRSRFETLEEYLTDTDGLVKKFLHLTQTAKTSEEKAAMITIVKKLRIEGICAKLTTATYCGGRAGNHLKWKDEVWGSFVVGEKPRHKANDGHRSVALYIYDNGRLRFVATARVFEKDSMPPIGSVVEVRYKCAHIGGGISQPWYGGKIRTDVEPTECVAQALKYKADLDTEAA